MKTNYSLTVEEWECVRLCVSNAPIPYDISKKKIPADILEKIGQPTKVCLLYTSDAADE